MPVAEMLDRMSAAELDEWRVYDLVEPIGDRRGDYHAAAIVATIQNTFREKGKQPKPIEDFLLFRDPDPEDALDPAERLLRKMQAMPQFAHPGLPDEDADDGGG